MARRIVVSTSSQRRLALLTTCSNTTGAVLIAALLLTVALAALGLAMITTTTLESLSGGNHRGAIEALYIAEAGAERAIAVLRTGVANGWDNELRGPDNVANTSDDGILTFGVSAAFNGGNYRVRVTDNDDGDGNLFTDADRTVLITSTGISPRGSTAIIEVKVRRNTLFDPPAAVTIVGEAETSFTGAAFDIDGSDYRLSDTTTPTGTHPAKYGIAVADVGPPGFQADNAAAKTTVLNSLAATQKSHVQGKDYVASPVTPSVGTDTATTDTVVSDFVALVKQVADNVIANPGVVAGSTSGTDNTVTIGSQTYALGSNTTPKITYIDATMAGSAAADFRGTINGSGILVIDGNDLIFRGNLNWNGLVIVNGPDVGFGLMGGGASKNINGALVVNERDTDRTFNEFLVNGNGKVHYSKEALDLAQTALNNQPLRRVSWRQLN